MPMRRAKSLLLLLTAAVLAAGSLSGCASPADGAPARKTGFAMDTVVTLAVYARAEGDALCASLLRELSAFEGEISPYLPASQTARVNEAAGEDFVDAPAAAALLRQIEPVCARSGGLFSPLMLPLTALWNVTGDSPRVPDEDAVARAVPLCAADGFALDGDRVKLLQKGAGLDFGAVGKGAACDLLARELEAQNARAAVCAVGGSVLVYGQKPDGSDWRVAVAVPGDVNRSLGELTFSGTAFVSTSGNRERCFEQDGKRYHHILDPRSGFPAETGLASVTVCAETGALSDALSTACFLLGYEQSLPLLDSFSAQAVFVTEENQVLVTPGLADRFRPAAQDDTLGKAAQ